jgi:hypothetical protein
MSSDNESTSSETSTSNVIVSRVTWVSLSPEHFTILNNLWEAGLKFLSVHFVGDPSERATLLHQILYEYYYRLPEVLLERDCSLDELPGDFVELIQRVISYCCELIEYHTLST